MNETPRRPGRRLLAWFDTLRFRQLLVLIIIEMILSPLRVSHGIAAVAYILASLSAVAVFLSVLRRQEPLLAWAFVGLWAIAAALRVAVTAGTNPALQHPLQLAMGAIDVVLLSGVVVAVLRFVLHWQQVSMENIFAAVVAYFLMALAFAAIYEVAMTIDPASIRFPDGIALSDSGQVRHEITYFSFVTITTLGYGDVVPVNPLVQVFAVLEAVLGQVYIAVVIAWLVSSYVAQKRGT